MLVSVVSQRLCFFSKLNTSVVNSTISRHFSIQNGGALAFLKQRGLIQSITDNESEIEKALIESKANKGYQTYVGLDPTADSLHIGNLLPLVVSHHFQKHGFTPIILMGGATGLIGDPSGRSTERNLLTNEIVAKNVSSISDQVTSMFERTKLPFKIVNNIDWYKDMSMISFLRDIGKNFRVNVMLHKDSVKSRMESGDGISFTEFSYQLLQAYDFYQLFKNYDCKLQIGGSDQWGNITAGIEYVHKVAGKQAYGFTIPLLTNSNGEKIGKSTATGQTIWLNSNKTPVFDFYQFFLRQEDVDTDRYLRLLTFLSIEEINAIMKEHQVSPEKRRAQHALAENITRFVHGEAALENAKKSTAALYGGDLATTKWEDVQKLLENDPAKIISRMTKAKVINVNILALALESQLVSSKGEARRLIANGGLYLNNMKVESADFTIQNSDIQEDKFLVLRSGKKSYKIVVVS